MTKFSLIAVTAVLGLAGLAAPALAAAPTKADTVPYCDTGNNDQAQLKTQMDNLATQLKLGIDAGSSIDVWNGCFKVMTTVDGKTTVAFYDPDSLKLIDTLGSSSLAG
jgi:hypothetical protein